MSKLTVFTMRLRGFYRDTATFWVDELRDEATIPLGGGWLNESHCFDDIYRVTIEPIGNDRAERMEKVVSEWLRIG